jgi:tetratricopeptide (TPR) repeat protein
MSRKVTFVLWILIVLGTATAASAQVTLVAGSPEDRALTAAMAETNIDTKIKMLEDFEKQFPMSKALSDVYGLLMEAFRQKNDNAKITEVAERAIRFDPENYTALIAVSRNYAIEKKNLDKALQYAQKAVEVLAKRKTEQRYNEDAAWKAYVDSVERNAAANLNFVKSVKPAP